VRGGRSASEALVPTVEERLARLEGLVQAGARVPGGNPSSPESPAAPSPKTPRGWLDVFQALSPLITPVLVALVGFVLVERVNVTLRQRQADLASGEAISKLVSTLRDPTVELKAADGAALTLAAYGGDAVLPLISVLEYGSDVTTAAAGKGLRVLGLMHRDATCRGLGQVVDNRTRLFKWTTHQTAIVLIGELGCRDQREDLRRYKTLLDGAATAEGLPAYRGTVQGNVTPGDVDDLERDVNQALAMLERIRRR
jgi:hypothetical protein